MVLILLDTVIETDHAGLEVAMWLREVAGRIEMSIIILRTGQPGLFSTDDILQGALATRLVPAAHRGPIMLA